MRCKLLLDVGAAQEQHRAQLRGRDILVDDGADLIEAQSELLQYEDAIQPRKLRGAVEPIAACTIDDRGFEQAQLVVIAQEPARNPGDAGEVADPEHAASITSVDHAAQQAQIESADCVCGRQLLRECLAEGIALQDST